MWKFRTLPTIIPEEPAFFILKNGKVLIIEKGEEKTMLEIFNPEDNSFKLAAKTKLPLYFNFIYGRIFDSSYFILKDGRVLFIESNRVSTIVEIFDPKTNKMKLLADITGLIAWEIRDAKIMPDTEQLLILSYNALVIDPNNGTIKILQNIRFRYDDIFCIPIGNNKLFVTGGGYTLRRRKYYSKLSDELIEQLKYPVIVDFNLSGTKN